MSRPSHGWPPLDTPPERRPPAAAAPRRRGLGPLAAAALVLAAGTLVAVGNSRPPSPTESIRAYACQHQSDAVLYWAEERGVLVDVRECPQEEK